MEEFLSILKPHFFNPPSSPVRTWRPQAFHARSPSFAKSIELVQSVAPEESEMMRAVQRSRGAFTPSPAHTDSASPDEPRRWYPSVLCESIKFTFSCLVRP